MSTDGAHREEWERLRAERAAARTELVRALDAVEVRAKDPFHLKQAIRKHPYLVAGIAAGAGAVLVNLLMPGGRSAKTDDDAREPRDAPSPLMDSLRDAALRIATPWVTRFVAEKLAKYVDLGEPAEPVETGVNGTQRH